MFLLDSLYQGLKHEICLSFHYTKSNLDASFVPFPIFTTASLAYRGAQVEEYLPAISRKGRPVIPEAVRELIIDDRRLDLRLPLHLHLRPRQQRNRGEPGRRDQQAQPPDRSQDDHARCNEESVLHLDCGMALV